MVAGGHQIDASFTFDLKGQVVFCLSNIDFVHTACGDSDVAPYVRSQFEKLLAIVRISEVLNQVDLVCSSQKYLHVITSIE
jgi:hypothetical protein